MSVQSSGPLWASFPGQSVVPVHRLRAAALRIVWRGWFKPPLSKPSSFPSPGQQSRGMALLPAEPFCSAQGRLGKRSAEFGLISLSVWAGISEFRSFGSLLRGGASCVSAVSSPRLYLQVRMSKTIKYYSWGQLQEPAWPPQASSQQEIRRLWHLLQSEPVRYLLAVAPAAATPETIEGLVRCCWGEPVAWLCPAAPFPDPGLWGVSCSLPRLQVQMCHSGVRELQPHCAGQRSLLRMGALGIAGSALRL